jgi:hypothetical protein
MQNLKVTTNGRLEDLEDAIANGGPVGTEVALTITAHLLGLLATFIGESLTLRLVREAWPEASLDI